MALTLEGMGNGSRSSNRSFFKQSLYLTRLMYSTIQTLYIWTSVFPLEEPSALREMVGCGSGVLALGPDGGLVPRPPLLSGSYIVPALCSWCRQLLGWCFLSLLHLHS